MKQISFSIRWKLLAGFLGLALLVLLLVLYAVSQIVDNRIREDINANFQEAGKIFEHLQETRFRQLRQTATLAAAMPYTKAAISTGDTATVNNQIRSTLVDLLHFDPMLADTLTTDQFIGQSDSVGLVLICDRNGMPLGQMDRSGLPEHSLADKEGMRQALEGRYPEQSHIWKQGDHYFNVITHPVFSQNQLLGTLSLGYPIRHLEAEQLARVIEYEVSYFVDNQLLATSMSSLSDEARNVLTKGIYNASFDIVENQSATTHELAIQDQRWLVYVLPMVENTQNSGGIAGYYAVSNSLTEALAPLYQLQWVIFIIGLAGILVAVVLGVTLTNHLTKPINLLLKGIERIENEKYDEPVPLVSRDEFGQLTNTFNNLVDNLRERLVMLKFISKATRDAVEDDISEIELGGERREVTVFFADIRGFTRWSEDREPEEVIELLNNYLHFQTDIVEANNGDVDKFVGDELVAIFRGQNKEKNAVNAAIKIQQVAEQIQQEHGVELPIGIGINSGTVIMGAMGSQQRMDYTVLGNNVNLGARLCDVAGAGQILVTETVYKDIERKIPISELDPVTIKGIANPVPVYEVGWNSEHLIEGQVKSSGYES